MFLSLNVSIVPLETLVLTRFVKATILVDLCPKQLMTLLTFAETPSQERIPSMGKR
jgi:hypothetical protein